VSARIPTTTASGAFPEDSFKYSPLLHARSLFVGFLQGLFSAATPGRYHWESEDSQSTSEIYITNESPIKDVSMGTRPGINVTRGPVQFYSLGLDDMLDLNEKTGTKTKSVLVPGTMTINCLSRISLETEFLAWICAEQLWLHRELLMAAGFFEIGRQPAIGSPTGAGSLVAGDSADEWFSCAVTCPFQFYRTSQTTPLNRHIIQNLQMRIRLRMQQVEQQQLGSGGRGGPITDAGPDLAVQQQGFRPAPYAPFASDVYGNTPNPGEGPPLLPLVPHPLNPAQLVTVRGLRPNSPAVRPPAIGGRTIPIQSSSVEQSAVSSETDVITTFKV
jgi:hypothetical protein